MIEFDEAKQLMLQYLAEMSEGEQKLAERREDLTSNERKVLGLGSSDHVGKYIILEGETIEDDFGWVFFFTTKDYLESGDFLDMPVGIGPVIISRKDGSIHETGSALPVEDYIENFRKTGNPHGS